MSVTKHSKTVLNGHIETAPITFYINISHKIASMNRVLTDWSQVRSKTEAPGLKDSPKQCDFHHSLPMPPDLVPAKERKTPKKNTEENASDLDLEAKSKKKRKREDQEEEPNVVKRWDSADEPVKWVSEPSTRKVPPRKDSIQEWTGNHDTGIERAIWKGWTRTRTRTGLMKLTRKWWIPRIISLPRRKGRTRQVFLIQARILHWPIKRKKVSFRSTEIFVEDNVATLQRSYMLLHNLIARANGNFKKPGKIGLSVTFGPVKRSIMPAYLVLLIKKIPRFLRCISLSFFNIFLKFKEELEKYQFYIIFLSIFDFWAKRISSSLVSLQ